MRVNKIGKQVGIHKMDDRLPALHEMRMFFPRRSQNSSGRLKLSVPTRVRQTLSQATTNPPQSPAEVVSNANQNPTQKTK